MTFHIVTLFPDAFKSYLGESIIARAIRDKRISVRFYNPRDFTKDKWARVDRRPYGGGPGMVLEAPAMIKAVDSALKSSKDKKTSVIIFSADGKFFDNKKAKAIADSRKHVVLVCGRYEGVDARVKKIFKAEEISVGPYVLTGGELPAMIIVDSVARQIEGVLGNFDSVEEKRVSTSEVYTRPEIIKYKGKNYRVPKILLSGHREKIDSWKQSRKKGK